MNYKDKKIIIATGGTGGHVFPAYSLAKHFLKKGVLGATDITGFGLARHAQNLSLRLGASGCRLDLSSLPLLDGALELLSSGIKSSLHDQNRAAVQIDASGLKVHSVILLQEAADKVAEVLSKS